MEKPKRRPEVLQRKAGPTKPDADELREDAAGIQSQDKEVLSSGQVYETVFQTVKDR